MNTKHFSNLSVTSIVTLFYFIIISISHAKDKIKNDIHDNISIHICYDGNPKNFSVQVLIRNNSNIDMNFSYLGTFHNYIYTLNPNGKLDRFIINLDMMENYKFEPEFRLKAGEWAVYEANFEGNPPSPFNTLKSHIESRTHPGNYQLWFDLVNWIDVSKGVYNKHTSNRLSFYVGVDGERIFINDVEAVKAFQDVDIKIGNSSENVEVVETTDGNYSLREVSNVNRSGNTALNQSERYLVLAWIVGGIFVLGLGCFIWKRSNQRIEG